MAAGLVTTVAAIIKTILFQKINHDIDFFYQMADAGVWF
jgi:hypothetical protein